MAYLTSLTCLIFDGYFSFNKLLTKKTAYKAIQSVVIATDMFLDKDKLYDKYIRSNKFCANKMKLLHDIQISQKNLT